MTYLGSSLGMIIGPGLNVARRSRSGAETSLRLRRVTRYLNPAFLGSAEIVIGIPLRLGSRVGGIVGHTSVGRRSQAGIRLAVKRLNVASRVEFGQPSVSDRRVRLNRVAGLSWHLGDIGGCVCGIELGVGESGLLDLGDYRVELVWG